jgi:hypothetical protein
VIIKTWVVKPEAKCEDISDEECTEYNTCLNCPAFPSRVITDGKDAEDADIRPIGGDKDETG